MNQFRCIPSSVSSWNNLSNDMREAGTHLSFRNAVKRDILCGTNVPSYCMKGQRRLSAIHARNRNNCSDFNRDLYQNHLTNDANCSCRNDNENALHYFFECENHSFARILMYRGTQNYHPPSVNTVLFGKSTLSDADNFLLFQAA